MSQTVFRKPFDSIARDSETVTPDTRIIFLLNGAKVTAMDAAIAVADGYTTWEEIRQAPLKS